jgi:hypothetical protein
MGRKAYALAFSLATALGLAAGGTAGVFGGASSQAEKPIKNIRTFTGASTTSIEEALDAAGFKAAKSNAAFKGKTFEVVDTRVVLSNPHGVTLFKVVIAEPG